jgi:hypothetical protein
VSESLPLNSPGAPGSPQWRHTKYGIASFVTVKNQYTIQSQQCRLLTQKYFSRVPAAPVIALHDPNAIMIRMLEGNFGDSGKHSTMHLYRKDGFMHQDIERQLQINLWKKLTQVLRECLSTHVLANEQARCSPCLVFVVDSQVMAPQTVQPRGT